MLKKLLQQRFIIPIAIVVCAGLGFGIYHGFIAPKYPSLPQNAIYYETTFPVGMRYSQGWYGTLEQAPMGETVWIYDDTLGKCVFSFPKTVATSPSGAQGGTTLTSVTWQDAESIIKSYPLSDYKKIDKTTLAKMASDDYFVGVWGGNKLAQKFLTPQTQNETLLSQEQLSLISLEQNNIETEFDPNRYFVLATGNNNWSSTGTWSANSNGSPTGASVPTSADAVLPSTSIATGATLTIDTNSSCLSMNWTGCGNTPTLTGSGGLFIYGSPCTLISGMVCSANGYWRFGQGGGNTTFTSGGLSLSIAVYLAATGTSTLTLGSNLTTSGRFYSSTAGTLLTSGYNLTCGGTFDFDDVMTLNMTGSTITCTQFLLFAAPTSITFDSSSKIVMAGSGFTFSGYSKSYPEVDFNVGGTFTITGSNTFANLVLSSATTQTIKFTDGTTQHVAACSLSGSAGHVHTLQGTSTGGWNLVKDGGGTVTVSYCTISYSVASPAATWYYDATCTYNSTSGWALAASAPTITISAASSITATTATLNFNVTNLNGNASATVTVYYGTSDGLQVPASWTYNAVPTSPAQPQGTGTGYYNVTGLTANTTYYFTAVAAGNVTGSGWPVASLNFTTLASTNINSVLGISYANITSIMGVAISSVNTVLGVH